MVETEKSLQETSCEMETQYTVHGTWSCVWVADVLLSTFLKKKVVIPSDCYSKWSWHIGSTWTSTVQKISSSDLAVLKNLQRKISFVTLPLLGVQSFAISVFVLEHLIVKW